VKGSCRGLFHPKVLNKTTNYLIIYVSTVLSFISSQIAVKEATVFLVTGYEDPIQEEAFEEGWHNR
jgi:hypothetical protein